MVVVLLNRGLRKYDLKDGKDKDGKPVKRSLLANSSIEALDQAEADQLLGYHDIVDAKTVMPAVTDKIADLEKKVVALEGELAEAKERLAKYEPSGESDDKKGGKKK